MASCFEVTSKHSPLQCFQYYTYETNNRCIITTNKTGITSNVSLKPMLLFVLTNDFICLGEQMTEHWEIECARTKSKCLHFFIMKV